MVGFAGEGQNFDGNGLVHARPDRWRRQHRQEREAARHGPAVDAQLFGNAILPPLGTRPTRPDKKPPYKPDSRLLQEQATRT